MKSDLDKARSLLTSGEYTCVLVKGGETLTSGKSGIAPLLEFIDSGKSLSGFSAADKIVGKAAALLYAYMGVAAVYGEVMSSKADDVLCKHGISSSFGVIASEIVNRKGDGVCPMEQTVENISDPGEALTALKEKLRSIAQK